nr:MAG TPA: hypothetical protein [Caudoviricetes sp.]
MTALFLLPHKKALLYPSRTAGLCRFLILFKDYNPSYVEYGDIATAKIRRKTEICRENRRNSEKFRENQRKTRNYL